MVNLLVELQYDKKLQRQMSLITYLAQSDSPISVPKLAHELNISKSTVRSYVVSINNVLPNKIQITEQAHVGLKLDLPSNISVDFFIGKLAKNSIPYSIIDWIHKGRMVSVKVAKAAEELFISISGFRRTLRHMNKVLKNFNLSISSKDLDFVGKESDIRFFLYTFYSCLNEPINLTKIENTVMEIYSTSFSDACTCLPISICPLRSGMWAKIIQQRIRRKKFVDIDATLVNEVLPKSQFILFKQKILLAISQKKVPI